MNDTTVSISGIVATKPRSRLVDNRTPVTSFRLVQTPRRFDGASQRWVDGRPVWVTVTCWRALALNTAVSVFQKDLVVVRGRLRTPQWQSEAGRRTEVEIEADAIGHNLRFGTSRFSKVSRAEPLEEPAQREAHLLARESEQDAEDLDLATVLGQVVDGRDSGAEFAAFEESYAGEPAPVRAGDGLGGPYDPEYAEQFDDHDREPVPAGA